MPVLGVVAFLVAAAAPVCDQRTTLEMRTCWDQQSEVATAELKQAYAKVAARMRGWGLSPDPLATVQATWSTAREKTCAFEYDLYLPGTIAPQLGVECSVRMMRARTKRLEQMLSALQTRERRPSPLLASPSAVGELNKLYHLYLARLTTSQRASLVSAQDAWVGYRDKACALEGGSCFTALDNERTAELQASWVGERFW